MPTHSTAAAHLPTNPALSAIRSGNLSAYRTRRSAAATAELLGAGERRAPEPEPHEGDTVAPFNAGSAEFP